MLCFNFAVIIVLLFFVSGFNTASVPLEVFSAILNNDSGEQITISYSLTIGGRLINVPLQDQFDRYDLFHGFIYSVTINTGIYAGIVLSPECIVGGPRGRNTGSLYIQNIHPTPYSEIEEGIRGPNSFYANFRGSGVGKKRVVMDNQFTLYSYRFSTGDKIYSTKWCSSKEEATTTAQNEAEFQNALPGTKIIVNTIANDEQDYLSLLGSVFEY